MASFDKSTPFMLLARIHVKPGCVDQYLELARITDEAVEAYEPGMINHTFDQDSNDPPSVRVVRGLRQRRGIQRPCLQPSCSGVSAEACGAWRWLQR